MRLALLGASGRIGQHMLAWALEPGHQVTALARNPQSLAAAAGLTVLTGDATEAGCVARLVTGADAVLSAQLGTRPPRACLLTGVSLMGADRTRRPRQASHCRGPRYGAT